MTDLRVVYSNAAGTTGVDEDRRPYFERCEHLADHGDTVGESTLTDLLVLTKSSFPNFSIVYFTASS
ncbi:MAG: hypothetical protein LBE07_07935, partial [Gordonia sp. (in: high G+C Gram-positive bacteria)]|nr:hypothetical protein [Gordonia sp. (in: high G+C Gram-positive bacteria)]